MIIVYRRNPAPHSTGLLILLLLLHYVLVVLLSYIDAALLLTPRVCLYLHLCACMSRRGIRQGMSAGMCVSLCADTCAGLCGHVCRHRHGYQHVSYQHVSVGRGLSERSRYAEP